MPYADPRKRAAYLEAYRQRRMEEAGTKPCECGCGTEIPAVNRSLAPTRYVKGHEKRRPIGSTIRHSAGYVLERVDDHPRAHNGYAYQHVLAWERANGRTVPDGWVVHHLNEVKDDNRPENLEVMPRGDHSNHHSSPEEMSRRGALGARARWATDTATRRGGPPST